MKTEIVEKKPNEVFPRLVRRIAGAGSKVILLVTGDASRTTHYRGLVVNGRDNHDHGIGHVADDYRKTAFEDFDGEVRLSNDVA